MMTKNLKLIFAGLALVFAGFLYGSTAKVQAFDPLDSVCNSTPEATVCQEKNNNQGEDPLSGDNGLITRAANVISIVTGVAAIIVIIMSGITMTMSQGESAKVKTARDTIIYAAVGLAIVILARSIIVFIVNKL